MQHRKEKRKCFCMNAPWLRMKLLNSSFEGDNVKYYELFFLPKSKIQRDIEYLLSIIGNNKGGNQALLDVGCGTGLHAYSFSSSFERVYAIDISNDMIDYARTNHVADNVDYECLDIVKQVANCEEVDVAVSLAHVIGYQLENESVESFIKHVHHSLKKDGLFVFSFYNMAAVYQGHLAPRTVTIDKDDIRLT